MIYTLFQLVINGIKSHHILIKVLTKREMMLGITFLFSSVKYS